MEKRDTLYRFPWIVEDIGMADSKVLWTIVGDLIEVMRVEAKEIEKLVAHVEQVTTRMPEDHQFSVVVSELAELQHRWQSATSVLHAKR